MERVIRITVRVDDGDDEAFDPSRNLFVGFHDAENEVYDLTFDNQEIIDYLDVEDITDSHLEEV